ncbi:uncharacterized protein OCT59_025986 [Rhizophagus irregularis]|nr:hypothetical protein OCT59_025986 [Rhizophagus irregularis]
MSSQDDDDQCKKCGEKYMSEYDAMYKWCKSCQINNLKQNFTNWTSENEKIDNLIQEMQLEINELDDMIFEWIPYDQFDDIKEIGEGSDKVHLAIWKDGPLDYDKNKNEYTRKQQNKKIVLKLYNLRNIINEFFIDQDKKYSITYIGEVLRIHGISQYPNTEDYIIVFQDIYCVKSGNENIDNIIHEMQLKIDYKSDIIFEWIPYNQLSDIQEIGKDDFDIIYSATWKNGPSCYNDREWTRKSNKVVTLKYLYNSQNVIKHLNMIKFNKYSKMYGVSQNPDTEIYILIFQIYIVKMRNQQNAKITLKLYNVAKKFLNEIIHDLNRYRGKNFGISQNPYTNDYITILQNDYDGTCTKCGKYDVESECHWSIWKNGPLSFHDKKWTRESNKKVYLRLHYLHYLQNTDKSLDKICKNDLTVYGISLNKNTKYCIIVSQYVNLHCERCGKELNYCERSAWKDGPLSYNKHDKYVEDKKKFILKQLDDSQNIATEFLDVIKKYSIKSCDEILTVYGISQDPDKGGNLYNFINKQYEKFDWFQCYMYYYWSYENQMVHRDLHTGNILSISADLFISICISDMGLCGKADNIDKTNVYGVMPYVAPEVLRGNSYTQAADIYSFGMIMYFIATGRQPFSNHAHDEVLALDICNGIRPDINDQEAPKCYIDLMKWCWNSNPDNRPNVAEVHKLVDIFHLNTCGEQRDYDIQEQFKKANKYKKSNYFLEGRRKSAIHSQAVYTSQLLNSLQKVFLILNV